MRTTKHTPPVPFPLIALKTGRVAAADATLRGRQEPRVSQKVLWTIRTTSGMTVDLWQRFVTKTREAGTTPTRALEDFIKRYAEGDDDANR